MLCLVCDRMAAEAADRPWSLTQILGAYEVPAAAAAHQSRETSRRCRCCPYGYHIDVDFLEYLNAIKAGSGLSQLKKIHGHRLRQRQAMETQLLMVQTPPTSSGQHPGSCEVSESSGSSSPLTPYSQSEDERDTTTLTMADLDASIADALNSIEALMEPRRTRVIESSSDNNTAMTASTAAGARSISTGDVRWTSDGQTSTSTGVMMTSYHPPSPSSVSCTSLHNGDSKHVDSSTPDIFPPTLAQSIDHVDRHACGYDGDSNSRSSAITELRSQSESTTVISTTVTTTAIRHHESSTSKFPAPSSDAADKSHARRPPPLAVKSRRAISLGGSRDHVIQDSARDGSTSAASLSDAAADAGRRLSAADGIEDIRARRNPAVDERQTSQRFTVSDSNITGQTTTSAAASVSVSTTGLTDVSSPGRQLSMPPQQAEPKDASTSRTSSKESSFSSVRALLNRKSGGSQHTGASRVDRPVRRSRQQVDETVQMKITTDDAPAAVLLPAETTSASGRSMTAAECVLQSSENECTATTTMTSENDAMPPAQTEELAAELSCCSGAEVAEAEPQFSDLPSPDQIDHDSLEASFEELAKAMAILSPAVERSRDGNDAKLDQFESSLPPPAIKPDVLMTIRKYIASSLQQMRMLEQQVRLIPVLQLRMSVLKEDKRLLKLQLQKAKNVSEISTRDVCVGVTMSKLPDFTKQQERGDFVDQLQSSVKREDVSVRDPRVKIDSDDSKLYCPNCNFALRHHSWQSPSNTLESMTTELSNHAEEESLSALQKELENVGYPSVSLLVSKLQGEYKHSGPLVAGRSRSVEETSLSVDTTCSLNGESSASEGMRRPKPPVPRKQISIRREEGKNHTTVGVQCTLLQDNKEDSEGSGGEILSPELDAVNKLIKRTDFRAYEPDLVTTHCLGGLSVNEHNLNPTAADLPKIFADKETETDRTLQHSTAVNTVSSTVEETLLGFRSYDAQSPSQTVHCSVNTDISGDIWSAQNMDIQLSVRSEPAVCEQLTSVNDAVEVKPFSKNVECLADMTVELPLTTTACNTETSWEQLVSGPPKISVCEIGCDTSELATEPVAKDVDDAFAYTDKASASEKVIRISDAKEAFCQTDAESRPPTREVACGHDRAVDSVSHTQLMNLELLADSSRGPPSNLVDVACGEDDVKLVLSVTDVACNTEVEATRDAGCSTTEDELSTKHVSCWADIKLSVCDKSSSTVTVTSSDVASLTVSLTTSEMSSSTEVYETVEAGCLTDVLWKPSTEEKGCNTDVETTSLSNMVAVPSTEDSFALTPQSTSVALNTDAWLLTADPTFLDTVKQILRPSVTESASMTDFVEKLQTSDASTSMMSDDIQRHTCECSTNTDVEVKPSLVDVESWARPAVDEVGCNTEAEDTERQMKDAASSVDIVLRPSANDASVNTDADAVERQDKEVTAKVDTSEAACDVTLKPQLRSISCGIDAEVITNCELYSDSVSDDAKDIMLERDISSEISGSENVTDLNDAEVPVFRFSHPPDGTDALSDFSAMSTAYFPNNKGENVCRLCGVQNIPSSSVANDASVTNISSLLVSTNENDEMADISPVCMVEWRQVGVGMRPKTKDIGCDAARILTTDTATITDSGGVDLSEREQETFAASERLTCLAKPTTRDSSCGADLPSLLTDDLLRHSEADRLESSQIPSRAVREIGVNTEGSGTIHTTAEAACNTETRTSSSCDVGVNTKTVTDVAHKPSRIPRVFTTATDGPDALVARPVTNDASCITDIVIASSHESEVLEKTDDKERSSAAPSTAEVACNTDVINDAVASASVGAEISRPLVRTVGCGSDLTLEDKKPSTRDAGCSARPDTKSRSCVTDPVSKETPVKTAVEKTRTGLQVTRKAKSQSVTTTTTAIQSIDAPSTPTNVTAVAAAAKSPTFDVACGTDLEFNSKYFNLDDSGLLRQLCADDLVEVIRRRRDPSSSLSSPTCDVACNTEYDSRPCTPARVNYSSYYVGAAVDPMPATAADVACGPDTPASALCHVACGTDDRGIDTAFQTSSDDVSSTTSENGYHLPHGPSLPTDQQATNRSDEDTATEDTKTEKSEREESRTTSTAVGDFDVREELVLRRSDDSSSTLREGHAASASRRGLRLDFGALATAGATSAADEQNASRREDFNNNDDERRRVDEVQTYSLDLRPDEDPGSPTRSFVEAQHDVKFIDDDDDSELDGVDEKGSDGERTTKDVTIDEDGGSPGMKADLGQRWGTVDLLPKPTAVSPLLTPSSAPLKSIMKSPRSSSENTLSKTKRGISFSQDTVFK